MKKLPEIKAAEVAELTLLSVKELKRARRYVSIILRSCDVWWLRTAGEWAGDAACIDTGGGVVDFAFSLVNHPAAVRPAFHLPKKYHKIKCGEKVRMGGFTWTVVPGKMALCDKAIGRHCFHDDWQAKDAGDYEKSDVKGYLAARLQKWKRKEAEKEEQAA